RSKLYAMTCAETIAVSKTWAEALTANAPRSESGRRTINPNAKAPTASTAVMTQPAVWHPCGTPVVAATCRIANGIARRRTTAIERSTLRTGFTTSRPGRHSLERPARVLREHRVVAARVVLDQRARAPVADVSSRDERVPLQPAAVVPRHVEAGETPRRPPPPPRPGRRCRPGARRRRP